jgi:autotransporter-associated beta strand protein
VHPLNLRVFSRLALFPYDFAYPKNLKRMSLGKTDMKKSHLFSLLTGLVLAIATSSGFGETLVINDDYNVTPDPTSLTGFSLGKGVNTGINPPTTTRLTGTAPSSANLRYINQSDRSGGLYTISNNKVQVGNGSNAGRFTLGTGSSLPYSFGSVLGISTAGPSSPAVYDITIAMANNDNDHDRMSFGIGTVESDNTTWDFGVQLYQVSGDAQFSLGTLINSGSSGIGSNLRQDISGQKSIFDRNQEVPLLIRITDAGQESGNAYNSRVRVSKDNGATWIYDTVTDASLTHGWRFDGADRYIMWDQAPSADQVTYDNFSITLFPEKTWNGFVNANWNNAGNWDEGVAPTDGDSLVFNGTNRQSNSNNRSTTLLSSIPAITFNNGGFTLGGTGFTIYRGITNLSGVNTINNNLILGSTITVKSSGTLTIGGTVSGSEAGLNNVGSGTLELAGANTYSGATTVSAGTLLVNGSTASGSAVSVASGATLGGSGTVSGAVSVSGTISPGNSAGTFTAGALTLNGGGTYLWEVDDSGNDVINAASLNIAATSSSKFNINVSALASLTGWSSTTSHQWTLVHTTGGITGFDAAKFALTDNFAMEGNSLGAAGYFSVAQSGNDLVLNFIPLTPANDVVQRVAGKGVKVATSDLLSNDTAVGGSITGIDTTGLDGTATLDGGWIFYVPSENDAASDAFVYTLTDANGKTATARVTINSEPGVTQTRQLESVSAGEGSFYGVPNTGYTVEYTESLSPANWQPLTTVGENGVVTTDANGLGTFTDPAPLAGERYYRITYP